MNKLTILLICFFGVVSWLNPYHFGRWTSAESDFFIFLSLILCFFYTIINYKKIFLKKQNFLFLFIISVPILQYFFGLIYFFGDAFIAIIYIIAFFIVLSLGNTLGENRIDRQQAFLFFSYLVIFSSLISVYIQLEQWLKLGSFVVFMAEIPPNGRPFANFGQPNTLATFLLCGLFSVLYLYERQKIGVFVCILSSSILLFGVVLTQSRTPWVFAIIFLIWWFWKSKSAYLRIKTQGILIGYGIFILLLWVTPLISDFLILNFRSVSERAYGGLQRIDLWQQMLIALKNQPWIGYGWQQVSVAQIETTLLYPFYGWTEHSHNIILDILIWNGIPLGIIIIILIIWWLSRFIALVNSPENFLFLSLIGTILVHAMFEYPLEYAFFLLPIGFLFGLIQVSETSHNSIILVPKSISIVALLLSITTYGVVFREYRIIGRDIQQATYEALNIGTIYAKDKAPDILILTQLQAYIALIRTQPRPHMTNEEIISVKKIAYRYSTKAALIRYTQVLALNGHKVEAVKHLNIIEKMYQDKINYNTLLQVQDSLAFKWNQSQND